MGAASGSGASRSESRISVEVRGIYTTPLTALLLAAGFTIVRPSPATQQRFGLPEHPGPADARADDLPDRQGVVIRGRVEAVSRVVLTLRRRLPFAVFWRDEAGQAAFFTQPVKQYFDGLRARYVPTVPGYYRLRTLGIEPPELTDLAEGTRVYRQLERELVWARLQPGREFTIVHLKAGGQVVRLRGTVDRVGEEYLVVRRGFRPGRVFDSLDEPILPGDWGLVVLPAGRWWARRLYYREDGTFIGEVVNLNTPVEVFPGPCRLRGPGAGHRADAGRHPAHCRRGRPGGGGPSGPTQSGPGPASLRGSLRRCLKACGRRFRGNKTGPAMSRPGRSGRRDSNPRPSPWQGDALPAELLPRLTLLYHFSWKG
jgi:hypothetical protein